MGASLAQLVTVFEKTDGFTAVDQATAFKFIREALDNAEHKAELSRRLASAFNKGFSLSWTPSPEAAPAVALPRLSLTAPAPAPSIRRARLARASEEGGAGDVLVPISADPPAPPDNDDTADFIEEN